MTSQIKPKEIHATTPVTGLVSMNKTISELSKDHEQTKADHSKQLEDLKNQLKELVTQFQTHNETINKILNG